MSEGFKNPVFKHHRAIRVEDIESKILLGLDGSFAELITDLGYNVDEPTVGVVVQFSKDGEIEGSRMVKCGLVKPKEINSKDIWPESEEGRLQIQEFNLSSFGDQNGFMTSRHCELDFKILVKKGAAWKIVKKGEYEQRGYSNLAFRANFVPLGVDKAKFLITAIPGDVATLRGTYGSEAGSRGFPGLRVHEGRAKVVVAEEVEHRWGLGIQPFYLVSDAALDGNK